MYGSLKIMVLFVELTFADAPFPEYMQKKFMPATPIWVCKVYAVRVVRFIRKRHPDAEINVRCDKQNLNYGRLQRR